MVIQHSNDSISVVIKEIGVENTSIIQENILFVLLACNNVKIGFYELDLLKK